MRFVNNVTFPEEYFGSFPLILIYAQFAHIHVYLVNWPALPVSRGRRWEKMLSDVHKGVDIPSDVIDAAIIRGKYEFYHYNVDGFDDRVSVFNTKPRTR